MKYETIQFFFLDFDMNNIIIIITYLMKNLIYEIETGCVCDAMMVGDDRD